MLQNLWSRNGTLLIDVTYHDDRRVRLLGKLQQHGCTFSNLCHTARRRLHGFGGHRLNRVNHHQIRLHHLDMLKHRLNHRFTHHLHISIISLAVDDSVCPQLQLPGALLPTHIEHLHPSQTQHRLQNQRRFANAWLATQQRHATRHQSTTQHTIQLTVLHIDAGFIGRLNLRHRDGTRLHI